MNMYVLVCRVPREASREHWISLELELQALVSYLIWVQGTELYPDRAWNGLNQSLNHHVSQANLESAINMRMILEVWFPSLYLQRLWFQSYIIRSAFCGTGDLVHTQSFVYIKQVVSSWASSQAHGCHFIIPSIVVSTSGFSYFTTLISVILFKNIFVQCLYV